MKTRIVAILAVAMTTISFQGSSAVFAGKPWRRTAPVSQVVVTPAAAPQKCEDKNVALQLLVALQQPVQVRVHNCESELQLAAQNLRAAVCRRDAAQASAAAILNRAEATACILKKMGCTVEVNCKTFSKEEVAATLNTLLGQYRSATCDVKAAELIVAERTAELKMVKDRVVKWQQAETALLAQVSMLRAEQDAAKQANLAAAANELIVEVNTMLNAGAVAVATSHVETAVVAAKVVTAQQPALAKPAAHVTVGNSSNDPKVNELLREVDQVLAGK